MVMMVLAFLIFVAGLGGIIYSYKQALPYQQDNIKKYCKNISFLIILAFLIVVPFVILF